MALWWIVDHTRSVNAPLGLISPPKWDVKVELLQLLDVSCHIL